MIQLNKKWLMILGCFLVSTGIWAQQKTITGTVTDPQGMPLPGVNVLVQGTQRGTQTDFDGQYSLEASEGDVLLFSFLGMKSISQTVGAASSYPITMQEDSAELDAVVVVGYGTQKKSDITGAISQVTAEELNDFPVQNTLQGIQGKAAGVNISSNARPGEVGSIRIRGNRSISGGNSPLYVVDGVPLQSGGLEAFNPNDIESVEILKDASATAIYGSRGANGVVLVTTKSGKNGRFQLNYDTNVSLERIRNLADYWNGAEYAEYRRDALRGAGRYGGLGYADPNLDEDFFGGDQTALNNILSAYNIIERDDDNNLVVEMRPTTPEEQELYGVSQIPVYNPSNIQTTDWGSYFEQTGIQQQHNLSANMGTEKMKAYLSAGYLDQKGTVVGQEYKRYSALMNLQLTPVNWLTLGGTINASYAIQDYGYSAGGSRGSRTIYEAALGQLPYAQPYDENGEYIFNPGGNPNIINPIRDIGEVINERKTARMFGSFFAEVELAEGLRVKTIFGPDIQNFRNGQFQSAESSLRGGGTSESTNYARYSTSENVSWTWENLVLYNKNFNEVHDLGVTLLQSSSSSMSESNDMTASDLPYDSQLWYNLGSTNRGALDGWGSGYVKRTLTSYMARINYGLLDKYLLTVTGRADAASVLSEGNKWDFFPSLAVGWNMHQEDFLNDSEFVNRLKLRVGYGEVGNQAIDPYVTSGALIRLPYVFGGEPAPGYVVGDPKGTDRGFIPNQDLGWERTKQLNIGVDFGFFNNRISGSAEYYVANTDGILLAKSPNSVTGYGSIQVNAGATRNQGIELSLSTVNIESPDFRWTSDITFTSNNSEIVSLVDGSKEDDISNGYFIGEPLGAIYDFKKIGIWQLDDQDEIDRFNENGNNFQPGDIRVADVNGDGVIDPTNDRQIIGSPVPDWIGGFINTFSYKNWDLSAFLYSEWGATVRGGAVDVQGQYVHRAVDYWTPDNPTNAYPRPNYNNGGQPLYYSSMNYQDGSFVKLRYVSLGYNFNSSDIERFGLSRLKVYAQALNPWLYSKTDFLDPDSSFQNGGANPSASSITTSSLVFGLNVSF
ncbi:MULTISPECIES: TonB-dependent receptor [unclassified Leeuwenhoekiella]|uniref:SusC/RagA family TonB-linked outer membrane protein n=1 Tax=unclassified Leeuwenhoekiella TaxID=2615029 RepID=UPI000C528299|nr:MULTISPECIES: TonB-dependent receptor [unclassified Leeuwenhoekiella]MAW97075.1 SusC/RagA family TonB-linked outer membrane protein [Leeuwenhoekiella sp.]MBA82591.1 SusC/RagA family TonB-linked outer membrane protein [Leeuwenhoekiella sp.]|tara:strand:+ start:2215 stop:5409 length:3195 start_codon:yes stop_codon:yes gene_type:complete